MNERPRFDWPGPADTAIDAPWKSLTEAANAAFRAGGLARAQRLYDRALDEALRRFRTDRAVATMADAPPMLVAASANAAECLARAGAPRQAVGTARQALEALRAAMLDTSEPTAFRQACFHHLKPALFDYVGRAGDAGIAPGAFQEAAMRTRDAALAFLSENRTTH